MLRLVRPSIEYRASYLEALREYQAEGLYLDLDEATLRADFAAFVETVSRIVPDDPARVPQTTYWAVDGDGYAGRIALRHALNPFLLTFGGHIGYDVRPSRRSRGYAKEMLRQVLDEARELGLTEVMLTCDDDNPASYRTIESSNGRLDRVSKVSDYPTPVRYYTIQL